MTRILRIAPATRKDIRAHESELRNECISLIREKESRPGHFKQTFRNISASVTTLVMVTLATTVIIAITMSSILGVILGLDGSHNWLWLYILCAPTGFPAVFLFGYMLLTRHRMKKEWTSRRRYAYAQGWLTEYELEVDFHSPRKLINHSLTKDNLTKRNPSKSRKSNS